MKKRLILLVLFLGLCLAQIAAPAALIVGRETALRAGVRFKFRVAPVDPYDALRGRYVSLAIDAKAPAPRGVVPRHGQTVYALLETGDDGFALITEIVAHRPPAHVAYVRARVSRVRASEVHLALPFDRYYLEEGIAPAAERAYREHTGREVRDAYVTVRIRGSSAVLEGLYIAGQPVQEFIRAVR